MSDVTLESNERWGAWCVGVNFPPDSVEYNKVVSLEIFESSRSMDIFCRHSVPNSSQSSWALL